VSTAMTMVKDLGYSVVLRHKVFCIEPIPPPDDEVLPLVGELKDDLIKAQVLMKNITGWCGSDRKRWVRLRDLVRANYEDPIWAHAEGYFAYVVW